MRAKDRIQRAGREVAGPSFKSPAARSTPATSIRPSFYIHSHRSPHGIGECFSTKAENPFAQLNGGDAYPPIRFFNPSTSTKEVMQLRNSARNGPVGSHRTTPPQGRTGVACNQAFSG